MTRRKRRPPVSDEVVNALATSPPDLRTVVKAEVAKALSPKAPGRRCDFCGMWVEGKGGNLFDSGWACSWCTLMATGDQTENTIMDMNASRLVGMRTETWKAGSGDLLCRAPKLNKGDPGYKTTRAWAHVDVAALREAWRERYGTAPPTDEDRARAAEVRKQALVDGGAGKRALRVARAQRVIARQQRVVAHYGAQR